LLIRKPRGQYDDRKYENSDHRIALFVHSKEITHYLSMIPRREVSVWIICNNMNTCPDIY
jgi:hypothetical protein